MEYKYNNLSKIPSQGYIEKNLVQLSNNATLIDISYHTEKKWLKMWFEQPLSPEDKSILDTIVGDSLGLKTKQLWRTLEMDQDYVFQSYIDGEWVTKNQINRNIVYDDPNIYCPELVVLYFSNPSAFQSVNGCNVDDDDSTVLILDVTSTNGTLKFPFECPYEVINSGYRFTGDIDQLNHELDNMLFKPLNKNIRRPQDGSIKLVLNDQDEITVNAIKIIKIEVIK